VSQALQKTNGVLELETNDSGFTVIYDGAKVTPVELVEASKRVGYEARIAEAASPRRQ
jgi:methylmalonyl-CoA mutase cobalamin-binding subunit